VSDIFISYAREDQQWVERFARVLEGYGWSLWWDRQIPTGESFDTVIERELSSAKCVIVVWSHHSVASDWVKSEAASARESNVLLPILIDDTPLPFEFRRLQTQSLATWHVADPHPGFEQLLKDIARLLGVQQIKEATAVKRFRLPGHPLWFLSLPTLVAAVVLVGLMLWSIPARVQVDLTTERIEFMVDAAQLGNKPILGALDTRSAAIEKFSNISFEPEIIELADPSQYSLESDSYPSSAWRRLAVTDAKVTITPNDTAQHPRVTIEEIYSQGRAGVHIDPSGAGPEARVTVETRGERNEGVTIWLAGQRNLNLSYNNPFKIVTVDTEVRGLSVPPFQKTKELTYKVRLLERAPWIEVVGLPNGLILSPTFPSDRTVIPIVENIPVTELEFTRQDSSGERVSALTGAGTITFPEYPQLGSVSIRESDAVGLEQLEKFTISQVALNIGNRGIKLVGDGIAKQISTKTGQTPINYRLTAFDALKHNQPLMALFALVAWALPTTVGAYRLYKEFKS
jgi:hypothetical protein